MMAKTKVKRTRQMCKIKMHSTVFEAGSQVGWCNVQNFGVIKFLGVPFNIASYALLTMMVAQVCDLTPGDFVHTFGDAHLYSNHMEQVNEQLSRTPHPLPQMKLNPAIKDIFGFSIDDFELVNYLAHPAIKAPIAI